MKYVILVAGRGTRISRAVGGIAKCLLEIQPGRKLIVHTIETMLSMGIEPADIVVVTGYQAGRIAQNLSPYGIQLVTNPFYDVTNSIASIWFAREHLTGDFIAMNGDTYFEPEILTTLQESEGELVMLGDSTRIEDADYRFNWSGDRLLKFGKELSVEETTGEYVGMAKASGLGVQKFRSKLSELIANQQHGMWWEDCMYQLSTDEHYVRVVDVSGDFWAEVDYIEDYQRILSHVASKQSLSGQDAIAAGHGVTEK